MSDRFDYKKVGGLQIEQMNHVREVAGDLEQTINENCPPSREKSLALTKLEEAVMWANKAITHREEN